MPARFISHYRLIRRLGAGGMGKVYLAEDTRLHRPVALKVMSAELAREPNQRKRFRAEANAVSGLSHPHICTIHEIGETHNGRPFLAMEYVEGQTLDKVIQTRRLNFGEILRVGIEVADALGVAHARGLVHRDIKPANLMLAREGELKVMDFGLAKRFTPDQLNSALSSAAHTRTGMLVGTPQYMSPEQALGHSLDPRTDIFSLGAVLYELVAGQRPFLGQTVGESINNIVNQTPGPLGLETGVFAPALERIIFKCLEKDPVKRYASAKELGTELRQLKQDSERAPIAVTQERNPAPVGTTHGDQPPTALWKLVSKAEAHGKAAAGRMLAIIAVVAVAAAGWVLLHGPKSRLGAIETKASITAHRKSVAELRLEDVKPSTTNAQAYGSYVNGLYWMEQRTKTDIQRAIGRFQDATNRDPKFAQAYAGLADCYFLCWEGLPREKAFARTREAASRASELDPTLSEPHAVLAGVKAYENWDWAGAEAEFQKAIFLSRSNATAHAWFARMLSIQRRWDEALAQIKLAHNFDESSSVVDGYWGLILVNSGKADQAIELLRQRIHRDPALLVHDALGWAYAAKGRWSEAIAEFEMLPRKDAVWGAALSYLGYAHARAGHIDAAQRILGEILESERPTGGGGGMDAALVYHGLGRDEFALAALEQMYTENPNGLQYLNCEFYWADLRSHPRVQAILRNLNLVK